jgi:hypothetical protein
MCSPIRPSGALWLGNSDKEARERQRTAAVAALIGIGSRDEIKGTPAAQLLASHNAAMECYRRAMIPEQTFEAYRENLTQANKLSRTYALLLDALNRRRGEGQQKVTVEHVHIHQGGHAIVGAVNTGGGGNERPEGQAHEPRTISYESITPMRSQDPFGNPCRCPAVRGKRDVERTVVRTEAVPRLAIKTPFAMVSTIGKPSLCGPHGIRADPDGS